MIRKLAEELAMNSVVQGTNDIRPLPEPAAPETYPEADTTSRYGFPDHTRERDNQGQVGVLSRALAGYADQSRQYQNALAENLGEHVRKTTGSVTMSRSAVRRNQKAGE